MNPENGLVNSEREAALAARLNGEPSLAFLPELYDKFPESEWFLVGGAVRDHLLNRPDTKDYDLIVRHLKLEDLAEALEGRGSLDLVGRSFGVLKFWPKDERGEPIGTEAVDIAWPRTEQAGMSGGYRDFTVQADPELPIERDLARRDFTANAIAWDMKRQRIIDPFDGRGDLARKVLRAVGRPEERFQEDYSRMLRGLRLACQLGFEIEPATWEATKRLMPRLDDRRPAGQTGQAKTERIVPYETVAKELIKAFAADDCRALELLESSGALSRLLPELKPLAGCEQSPDHHSEGDVWTHTKLAMTKLHSPEFGQWFPGEKPSAETILAVLLHDIGKPETARRESGVIKFYGHDEVGARLTAGIADRLKLATAPGGAVQPDRLAWLVRNHLFPNLVRIDEVKRTTLAKYFLADREAGRALLQVACADALASLPAGGQPDFANLRRVMDAVRELEPAVAAETGKPPRLVTGDEVMNLTGLEAGPGVGRLLEEIEEKQLRGEISTPEQAKDYLHSRYRA